MTSPSERDLRRDLENLKEQGKKDAPTLAFETDDGRYYDKKGNRIEDFSDVIFIVPPELWRDEWGDCDGMPWSFTPPPE